MFLALQHVDSCAATKRKLVEILRLRCLTPEAMAFGISAPRMVVSFQWTLMWRTGTQKVSYTKRNSTVSTVLFLFV